jgi:hypothetical protein
MDVIFSEGHTSIEIGKCISSFVLDGVYVEWERHCLTVLLLAVEFSSKELMDTWLIQLALYVSRKTEKV